MGVKEGGEQDHTHWCVNPKGSVDSKGGDSFRGAGVSLGTSILTDPDSMTCEERRIQLW